EADDVVVAGVEDPFVADLGVDGGHGGLGGAGGFDLGDGVGGGGPVAVAGLEHFEVDGSRVGEVWGRAVGGGEGDGGVEGMDGADVFGDVGPALFLESDVVVAILGEVVGHGGFACNTPEARVGAVAGDEVAPVLFHLFDAEPGEVVAPGTDEAWGEAVVG